MAETERRQWVFTSLVLGSDHAGFALKEKIVYRLKQLGIRCEDVGTYSTEACDYPDYALKVAQAVKEGRADAGILFCGTGIGTSIVANKLSGIRCAVCWNEFTARMARSHNDANVLSLGGRVVGEELAWSIVETFLATPFSGESRHIRRLQKIAGIEKETDGKRGSHI